MSEIKEITVSPGITILKSSFQEISGWVSRDIDGNLCLFNDLPTKDEESGVWVGLFYFILPRELYPNVTWESGCLQIKIILSH